MAIDIAHLIRTGNTVEKPEMKYSEYIVLSAEYFRRNDQRMGQSYFNVLTVIRPEIAEEIRGTEIDAFYDNAKLPAMLAAVYKVW